MSEWISVKDALPDDSDKQYLVLESDGDMNVYYYDRFDWLDWDITHWMPLPEPPK